MEQRLIELDQEIDELTGEILFWQDELDNLEFTEVAAMRKIQNKIENLWVIRLTRYEEYTELRGDINV